MTYVTSLRLFVRVFELGNMSAAARDQRVSAAVASSRISELEKQLGVRLFNRTTRSLQPTEHGKVFYHGALRILEAIQSAEAEVSAIANAPRGSIYAAVPLGIGRRLIAPQVPDFKTKFPEIDVRLRLSDRKIDLVAEGLDLAFVLGTLEDSSLRMRHIADCPRILCASPGYIERHGMPQNARDLIDQRHACLLLRFPGASEFRWNLQTADGPKRFEVAGPFESDDGDVLTDWALAGHGIVNKPVFEVASRLRSGALVPVAEDTPPTPVQLACLFTHKRYQDPKIRLFIDFAVERCRQALAAAEMTVQLPR